MSSSRSRRRVSKNISGGKLFSVMQIEVSCHFVAMVTQIPVKCTLFETFVCL